MASRWVTTTPWAQKCITTKLSKIKQSRAPSRNRTRITSLRRRSLAVRPSVLVFDSVGPVRIELTSFGLRDRCITLSATIPCVVVVCFVQSARKESNLQPSSYKDAALTTEPRAASRAGGNRTHTERIKSPSCCLLHHNPMIGRAYAFQSQCKKHVRFLFRVVVVSGSPEDRTQRDPRIRRIWATSPRLPCCIQKSDTSESNRDPPAPKAGVLPSAPVSDVVCRVRRG